MGFDTDGFLRAELVQRRECVAVPELAAFFSADDQAPTQPPTWTVRAISAGEIARADAAKHRHSREAALAQALAGGSAAAVIRELQGAMGRDPAQTEPDLARRLEILAAGSLDPPCSLELGSKLATHYPSVFYKLTNTILTLSGRGSDAEKKPSSSGPTAA